MSGRRWPIVVGAVLVALAALLALLPVVRAAWSVRTHASASNRSAAPCLRVSATMPTPLRLELRLERPNGAVGHLAFTRSQPTLPWQPEGRIAAPGVILGDGYPVFASVRFLEVHGLAVRESLQAMSAAIADEHAEDVTAIQMWGGELAVCLWSRGKVTRAYLAGPVFDALLSLRSAADPGAGAIDPCAALPRLMDPEQPAPVRIGACAAALAGCSGLRATAIERLRDDCARGEATACEVLMARDRPVADLWPEIDDALRWMLDLLEAGGGPSAGPQGGATR